MKNKITELKIKICMIKNEQPMYKKRKYYIKSTTNTIIFTFVLLLFIHFYFFKF